MADTKLKDLTALTAPSGDDLLYVVNDPAGTPADRKLALNNLFTRGTVTASSPIIDAAQTWNNAAVTFTGLKLNVTDTASASGSMLLDLQVGGSTKLRVDKTGALVNTLNTFGTSNFTLRGGTSQNFGINFQGTTAYFQSTTSVGVGITVSGTAGIIGASSSGQIGFHATSPGSDAIDSLITRRAAANLRLGAADAAAPVAQTLSVQSVVAGTTNTAGANLTITGSQGTGTGAGGSIIFQVAPAGSSGTAQNALADALTINSSKYVILAGGGGLYSGSGNSLYCGNALIFGGCFRLQDGVGVAIPSNMSFLWSSNTTSYGTPDLILTRDAANTLALRNSTNAQTFRWYRTYTDASNYERGALQTGTDQVILAAETAGTGADNIDVTLTPAGTGNVRFGTHTATSDTAVSGYIEIKDSGGTVRKLAVIT